jgi:hypothetical protein
VSDRHIRAILDSTAIVAFAHGADSVGEIISEITDEGVGFAVPDLCLIEAAADVGADHWPTLALLVGHSHCL